MGWSLGYAYALAGRRDSAHGVIADLSAGPPPLNSWGLAEIHAALGEVDAAIGWLERAYERRFNWMVWMATTPPFIPLRDDPRF